MEVLNLLQAMHGLGLRKFFFGGIGPLGCIPNQKQLVLHPMESVYLL